MIITESSEITNVSFDPDNTILVEQDVETASVCFYTTPDSNKALFTQGVTGCIAIMFRGNIQGTENSTTHISFPFIAMKHWSGFDGKNSEHENIESMIEVISGICEDIKTEFIIHPGIAMTELSISDIIIMGGEKCSLDHTDPKNVTGASGTENEIHILHQILDKPSKQVSPSDETQKKMNELWIKDEIFADDKNPYPSRDAFFSANVIFENFINCKKGFGNDWGGIDILMNYDAIRWYAHEPSPSVQLRF